MAITRSATTLLPAADLVAIRTRLADHYGSELHDGDDRRVLCIHVPHDEPDPVGDVEAAVEYLEPGDVEQATHVLLIGHAQMAQVYVEPFKQLLADRVRMDERIASEWRQRLPGGLSHQFFRDVGDPRRRWRLAVQLPVESMADVEDDLLEPLADELGPQLETPRVRDLAAVYLLAGRDHVRLAPDLFVQELLKTWRDEERRRRVVADRERVVREERERKEHERRKLMAELDRTLRERSRVARAPLRRSPGLDRIEDLDLLPGTRLSPRDPAGATSTPHPSNPPVPTESRPSLEDIAGSLPVAARTAPSGATRQPGASPAAGPSRAGASPGAGALLSTDDVIAAGPGRPRPAGGEAASNLPRQGAGPPHAGPSHADPASLAEPAQIHKARVRSIQDKVEGLGRRAGELIDRPGGRLGRIAQHLMDCGFDVLVRPETSGPRIDLAAERPGGELRRIVVRVEDRLTASAADRALTLARTLQVDQVVVVAETAEPEAERRLLATKVQWLTPRDLAAARL